MDRLEGRHIIVTGATGIAAASARRFAAEGATVAIVSRTAASVEALAQEIVEAGGRAHAVTADLTDFPAAQAAMEAALGVLGRVDGLFNVAGGSGRRMGDGPLHELTPEAYEATMRLNATTHVVASRAGAASDAGAGAGRARSPWCDREHGLGAVERAGAGALRHPRLRHVPRVPWRR